MEAFGILGFVFGLLAFVRLEKLTKTLKEKNILESDDKDEQILLLGQFIVARAQQVPTRVATLHLNSIYHDGSSRH